jgi:hypothetical protein
MKFAPVYAPLLFSLFALGKCMEFGTVDVV